MRISDWSSDVCSSDLPVRVEARERVSRAPKNTERLFNTAPIRRPDPRRSLWRCKLGGGGAGGYVSFGGGYAGVECGYVRLSGGNIAFSRKIGRASCRE